MHLDIDCNASLLVHNQGRLRWRGMRFVLSTHCMTECLEILAKAMKACPNLKTVNVYFAQTDSARTIKTTFDGSALFRSVEKVILPSQAHAILRCCPNVKEVVNHQGDGSQIVTAMQTKCKKVEVLSGVCPDMSMMKSTSHPLISAQIQS